MGKEKDFEKLLADEQTAHSATKAALEAEKKAHAQTAEEAAEAVADVTAKLASASAKVGKAKAKDSVKVDGKEYEITIQKFSWNGESKTAKDITADKALAAELVAEGFGGLKLISK
jgi:hypothetical protein